MITYMFDGSFEGFLTCVYDSYYNKETPSKISSFEYVQYDFLYTPIEIKTDLVKYSKVYSAIYSKISRNTLRNVYFAFLSQLKQDYLWIYNYISLGFKLKEHLDNYITHPIVSEIHSSVNKVIIENHRMKGLLRFHKATVDIYLAKYEPDHDITRIIVPHFTKRLSSQNFIIYDIKRKFAALYNQEKVVYASIEAKYFENQDTVSDIYTNLWKNYHNNISIFTRKNLKQQKNYMPIRYWKHLDEMLQDLY
jgi:probable DNA metabolism protein